MSKVFSIREIGIIKQFYPILGGKKTQEALSVAGYQRSLESIYTWCQKNKVRSCFPSRFKPGHVPRNKGKKISKEQYAKTQATMFKPGGNPNNTKEIGSITQRYYGSGPNRSNKKYLYIKIGEKKWDMLHRHIWKKYHGEIPKDMCCVFKDRNQENCVIDNLELITRAENARRNVNYEKSKQTFESLPDRHVIKIIAKKNKTFQQELKKNPDLIEVVRQSIILKRELKKQENEKKSIITR